MSTRHKLWLEASYICDFDVVPPFSARTLSELAPGEVRFRAERSEGLADQVELVTLDVSELWLPGPDPLGDRRLESEGCHISALRWHVQVSAAPAERFAERLDVVPAPDPEHPRIHRHPFGEPNHVRVDANFDPTLDLARLDLPLASRRRPSRNRHLGSGTRRITRLSGQPD